MNNQGGYPYRYIGYGGLPAEPAYRYIGYGGLLADPAYRYIGYGGLLADPVQRIWTNHVETCGGA